MADNPRTSDSNGKLWGARAKDWAQVQEPVHKPIYDAVFDATGIGHDSSYLDVGCGSGLAVQMACNRGANASGIDAADELLRIARTRAPQASFNNSDLEALPFLDHSFDVVTGFNSFQYAGNPSAALAEARRVAKEDGTVVVVTWGQAEGMEAAQLVAALKPLMPPPPPGAPGPFALSDESALRNFASQAALNAVDVFDVESPFVYRDLPTAVRGLCSAGVAARAMELVGEEKVEEAYRAAITPFIKSDGSVQVAATFRCLIAKPAS